jgi:hypothetical protein
MRQIGGKVLKLIIKNIGLESDFGAQKGAALVRKVGDLVRTRTVRTLQIHRW